MGPGVLQKTIVTEFSGPNLMSEYRSDESTLHLVFRNNGCRVLHDKDYPGCYERKVQKPAPVMVYRG